MIYLKPESKLDPNEKLWRYMSFAKFVSLLNQKSLWLARTDTFHDKREGRFPNEMWMNIEKAYASFPDDDPSPVKDAADFQDYLVKNTFMSCWHKNLDENMVMWEIYGRIDDAVAVQTSAENLRKNIDYSNLPGNFLILDNVEYKNPDEVEGNLLYERCFFLKRAHFEFENEVRLSLDTYSRYNPRKDTPMGYLLPIVLDKLIEGVLIHPDSSDWFFDVVKSVAIKYCLKVEIRRGSHGHK